MDRGAPRKTWRSCVKRDMKAMGIKEEMAQDRCAWRNITGGPTRASADAWNTVCVLGSRTLNEYDDDEHVRHSPKAARSSMGLGKTVVLEIGSFVSSYWISDSIPVRYSYKVLLSAFVLVVQTYIPSVSQSLSSSLISPVSQRRWSNLGLQPLTIPTLDSK